MSDPFDRKATRTAIVTMAAGFGGGFVGYAIPALMGAPEWMCAVTGIAIAVDVTGVVAIRRFVADVKSAP